MPASGMTVKPMVRNWWAWWAVAIGGRAVGVAIGERAVGDGARPMPMTAVRAIADMRCPAPQIRLLIEVLNVAPPFSIRTVNLYFEQYRERSARESPESAALATTAIILRSSCHVGTLWAAAYRIKTAVCRAPEKTPPFLVTHVRRRAKSQRQRLILCRQLR